MGMSEWVWCRWVYEGGCIDVPAYLCIYIAPNVVASVMKDTVDRRTTHGKERGENVNGSKLNHNQQPPDLCSTLLNYI